MRLLILLAGLAFAGVTSAGNAQPATDAPPVVVELYTSQGCASCPPADALLSELAGLPGVIALAFHVDYWDYLGWKDTYASPAHSARQRAYAKRAGSRTIFTPQIVVQGTDRVKGHDKDLVRAAIDNRGNAPPSVHLAVTREGDMVRIDLAQAVSSGPGSARNPATLAEAVAPGAAAAPLPAPRPAAVHVATFLPSQEVAIHGGENAGREITYSNVVTSWETVADWDGAGPLQIVYRAPKPGPLAVIVQEAKMGPVLTAASLP